jgi:hypothetical protein
VLLPYLLADRNSSIVDEIHLWVNTDAKSDLEYFARMEREHLKIKRVYCSGELVKALYDATRDHWQFSDGIFRFYRGCVADQTIYVKIDDDICFIHDQFFTNMCNAVLTRESTNYACTANVYNVPHVTKILQDRGTIDDTLGHSTGNPRCPFACTNGEFAGHLHEQFIQFVRNGNLEALYFQPHQIEGRQRIGVMGWTGQSFKQFDGQVGPRDEVELTTSIPEKLLKPLWIVGDALVCHLAFSHQRAFIEDRTNILKTYLDISIMLNGDTAS